MPAQTPTDIQNLINGSDLKSTVTLSNSATVNGVLTRAFSESLDINGRSARLNISNADAALVGVGEVITIESVGYTIRAIEPGDDITGLVLEVQ